MTPQEKAQDLIEQFMEHTVEWDKIKEIAFDSEFHAKQCALIAVDEIILSAPFEPVDTDWDEAGASAQYWYPQKLEDSAKWWGEVKQEIEKL